MLVFHRKEQFDIAANGIKKPIVVVAWKRPGEYSRLFCLWSGGVWLRWFGKVRLCWQWGKGGLTQRALDVCPKCFDSGYRRVSPTILAKCSCKHGQRQ